MTAMPRNPEYHAVHEPVTTYAEVVSAFGTALSDQDCERIGQALSAYYGRNAALPPAAERMRVLRAALAQSMDALN